MATEKVVAVRRQSAAADLFCLLFDIGVELLAGHLTVDPPKLPKQTKAERLAEIKSLKRQVTVCLVLAWIFLAIFGGAVIYDVNFEKNNPINLIVLGLSFFGAVLTGVLGALGDDAVTEMRKKL